MHHRGLYLLDEFLILASYHHPTPHKLQYYIQIVFKLQYHILIMFTETLLQTCGEYCGSSPNFQFLGFNLVNIHTTFLFFILFSNKLQEETVVDSSLTLCPIFIKIQSMSCFTSCFYSRRKFHPTYDTDTTNPTRRRNNVYLSFHGIDYWRSSFVSSLHTALGSDSGILLFVDYDRLTTTNQEMPFSESSLNIIGECEIAIVIFSKNYTNSRLCLQELEKITKYCRTTPGLIILPFLVNMEEGMYGRAFHDFLDRVWIEEISKEEDKFMTWLAAFTKATLHSTRLLYFEESFKESFRSESEYIKEVVEHVTAVLNKRDMSSAFYRERINSCAQDVIQLLKQSNHPLLLGIWGMEGIGKTTIAQTIYDQIGPYFEHKCFVKDIRGVWEQRNGCYFLQKKLSAIDKSLERKIKIPITIESAKVFIKEKLQHKRVLIILDDVYKLEQLNAVCGSREWFGPGSKIIITTTNRHLLKEHGVDHIYKVKELAESESLELFNLNAFSQTTTPQGDFGELCRHVVAYSGGLPLALEEFGSFLNGKGVQEWKRVLRSLERFSIPVPRLLKGLRESFNALSDEEKQIFFDIACFFNGMDQNDVLQTLSKSTQYAALQISLLEDKSLVTIDENNKLQMHAVLQAMARDVIKRKSRNVPDQQKMYDVFLSFRGNDSRVKFISHLHSSLQNAGIHVFKDDDEIQRGNQISISLLRAIGRSRISIVVLSANYANSRWCMLELEKIMEIDRSKGLVVVPVFYEVDPSDVRHQKGQFGKGFDDLISPISLDESTKSNWRRELFDICGIAGFVLLDSRNESADVKNIIRHVTHLLDRTQLFVAEHPVGVESRVQVATKLLNIEKSEDVLLLGIWGMGGMGKTTIAKAIYNEIGSKFEGRSFLLNIREFWETNTDGVSLQQQVLCDVYKTTTFKISDIESGKNILKQRLSQNRVLFVLDDVNELDQINAL